MTEGEYLSLLINLLVGAYFSLYYPRYVGQKMASGGMPPFFAAALPVVRLLGFAIVAASLGYAAVRLLEPSL